MIKTNIYTNPAGLTHDTGSGYAESIARLEAVLSLFDETPFDSLPVIPCNDEDTSLLLYAHPQRYIEKIADMCPDEGFLELDNEYVMSKNTYKAAVTAANTVCRAVEDVMAGKCDRAFCAVRPPGHHTMPEEPLGYCFFGNVFIGARHAQEKCGAKRIAIVDFDVHHGNGTDKMVKSAENMFFVSSHQAPLYPDSGYPEEDIPGKTLSIPLPPGSGSAEFRKAYEEKVFPAIDAFKPDLIMISAGFDAHKADPLAELNLVEDDYFWVAEKLVALAVKHCGGKIVSSLEGGYDIKALKASVAAHLMALAALGEQKHSIKMKAAS